MKLLTNKQDPRNRIIVVDAYINGDRIVCDANSDDFDLWEDCWTIEDLEDEPINPFDTKLFQDGVKEGRRLEREDIKKEPIPIPDKFSGLQSLLLQYLQSAANRTDDAEIESDTDLWGRKILHYVWKYSEKQKEQKPADNQFPPLDGLDAIKAQYYDRGFKNGFDEGVDSVKPAEWSEEDEKIRRNLMSLLANMRGDRITEETYQKYYPWLKDLHLSWKPSEEQMQYLLAVINDPNNAGAESCHLILESLYNDLKKFI